MAWFFYRGHDVVSRCRLPKRATDPVHYHVTVDGMSAGMIARCGERWWRIVGDRDPPPVFETREAAAIALADRWLKGEGTDD